MKSQIYCLKSKPQFDAKWLPIDYKLFANPGGWTHLWEKLLIDNEIEESLSCRPEKHIPSSVLLDWWTWQRQPSLESCKQVLEALSAEQRIISLHAAHCTISSMRMQKRLIIAERIFEALSRCNMEGSRTRKKTICNSKSESEVAEISHAVNPVDNFAKLGARAGLSFAFAFLKKTWRCGDDTELCTDVLQDTLFALQSLPPALLFDNHKKSSVWGDIVNKTTKFLVSVVTTSQVMKCVAPCEDRQLSVAILLELAVQQADVAAFLDIVTVCLKLSREALTESNRITADKMVLSAPLVPSLTKLAQIDGLSTFSGPPAEFIQDNNLPNNCDVPVNLKMGALLVLCHLNRIGALHLPSTPGPSPPEQEVFGWGQLSNEESTGMELFPIQCETLIELGVKQIACCEFGVVVLTQNGQVYQQTHGNNGPRLKKCFILLDAFIQDDVTIKKIVAHPEGKHFLAITTQGELYSWGFGDGGVLGNRDNSYCKTPTRVNTLGNSKVVDIACGSLHSACITEDGALYTWGKGKYGRLGHGNNDDKMVPTKVTKEVEHVEFVSVACGSGDAHTLAVSSDGKVWSWGDGDYGKLGRGSCNSSAVPQVVEKMNGKEACNVYAGPQYSLALSKDGKVYWWGKRMVPVPDKEDHVKEPALLNTGTHKIAEISVGYNHCVLLTTEGVVLTWGSNDKGQLGNGTTILPSTTQAVQVSSLIGHEIRGIACGPHHTLAWSAAQHASIGTRIPFCLNVSIGTIEKLAGLLAVVCDGIASEGWLNPTKDEICLIVSCLNLLTLQLHAAVCEGDSTLLLPPPLLTTVKERVVFLATDPSVNTDIQLCAQNTLKSGWMILLKEVNERAKMLPSICDGSETPGQKFMFRLLIESLLSPWELHNSLISAINNELHFGKTDEKSKKQVSEDDEDKDALCGNPLLNLIQILISSSSADCIGLLQAAATGQTVPSPEEDTSVVKLLFHFQWRLISWFLSMPRQARNSGRARPKGACEDEEEKGLQFGAEMLLQKYTNLICNESMRVLTVFTEIMTANPALFPTLIPILHGSAIGVLLPDFVNNLVLLQLKRVAVIVLSCNMTQLKNLLVTLNNFNLSLPSLNDESGLNLNSELSKINTEVLPTLSLQQVEQKENSNWVILNRKVYNIGDFYAESREFPADVKIVEDYLTSTKNRSSYPDPPQVLHPYLVGILEESPPANTSCEVNEEQQIVAHCLDIERSLALLLGLCAKEMIHSTPVSTEEQSAQNCLSQDIFSQGMELQEVLTDPQTEFFHSYVNGDETEEVIRFTQKVKKQCAEKRFIFPNVSADHPLEKMGTLLTATLMKHTNCQVHMNDTLSEVCKMVQQAKKTLMHNRQELMLTYDEVCAPVIERCKFLLWEIRPVLGRQECADSVLINKTRFKSAVESVIANLKSGKPGSSKASTTPTTSHPGSPTPCTSTGSNLSTPVKGALRSAQSVRWLRDRMGSMSTEMQIIMRIMDFVLSDNKIDIAKLRYALQRQVLRAQKRLEGAEFFMSLISEANMTKSVQYFILKGWMGLVGEYPSPLLNYMDNINLIPANERLLLDLSFQKIDHWTLCKLRESLLALEDLIENSPSGGNTSNSCKPPEGDRDEIISSNVHSKFFLMCLTMLSCSQSPSSVSMLLNNGILGLSETVSRLLGQYKMKSSNKVVLSLVEEVKPPPRPSPPPPMSGGEVAKLLKPGVRVVRGPDWKWGEQDGQPPGEGCVISEVATDGWVRVHWDSGQTNSYRMGKENRYDLKLADVPNLDKTHSYLEVAEEEIETWESWIADMKSLNVVGVGGMAGHYLSRIMMVSGCIHSIGLNSVCSLLHHKLKAWSRDPTQHPGFASLNFVRGIAVTPRVCLVLSESRWMDLLLSIIGNQGAQGNGTWTGAEVFHKIMVLRLLGVVLPAWGKGFDMSKIPKLIDKLFSILGHVLVSQTWLPKVGHRRKRARQGRSTNEGIASLTAPPVSTVAEEVVMLLRKLHSLPDWNSSINGFISNWLKTITNIIPLAEDGEGVIGNPSIMGPLIAVLSMIGGVDKRPRLGSLVDNPKWGTATICRIEPSGKISLQLQDHSKKACLLSEVQLVSENALHVDKLPMKARDMGVWASIILLASGSRRLDPADTPVVDHLTPNTGHIRTASMSALSPTNKKGHTRTLSAGDKPYCEGSIIEEKEESEPEQRAGEKRKAEDEPVEKAKPPPPKIEPGLLWRQLLLFGVLKAARVLFQSQSRLRAIMVNAPADNSLLPKGFEASATELLNKPGSSQLLRQLMVSATRPSPVKAIFSQEELEVAALSLSQLLMTELLHPDTISEPSSKAKKVKSRPAAATVQRPKPITPVIRQILDMGFTQHHIEHAITSLGVVEPRIEQVVAWLLENPPPPQPAVVAPFTPITDSSDEDDFSDGEEYLDDESYYKLPANFPTLDAYAEYVKKNIRIGMQVKCISTYEDVMVGDTGPVMKIENEGLHDLNVNWTRKAGNYWVKYVNIQLLGQTGFQDDQPIKKGDRVRVKASVTTPKYKWGSVSHQSIGIVSEVIASKQDVYVDFPEQKKWTGHISEMEKIPVSHVGTFCTQCNQCPIQGPLFSCTLCRGVDMCLTCFKSVRNHSHPFNRINEPGDIPMPAGKPGRSKRRRHSLIYEWRKCVKSLSVSSREGQANYLCDGSDQYWTGSGVKHWIRLEMHQNVLVTKLTMTMLTEASEQIYHPMSVTVLGGDTIWTLKELNTVEMNPGEYVTTLLRNCSEEHRYIELVIRGKRPGIDIKVKNIGVVCRPRTVQDDIAKGLSYLLAESAVSPTAETGEGTSASQEDSGINVYLWGLNDKEQLGGLRGSKVKTPSLSPVFTELGVTHVAGGSKSLFACTSDGKVYACGEGSKGRLGLGHSNNVSVPQLIKGLSQYVIKKVAIHSVGKHCLAINTAGRVFSWGDGDDGKLGHGNCTMLEEPKMIDCLKSKRVVDIACGDGHSAVITSSGELYSWGLGTYGRLGHGDTKTYHKPKLVSAFRGYKVVTVACGSKDAQTLAVTDNDQVWSWGDGDFGKLGRGGHEGCHVPKVIDSLNGTQIVQIHCGAQFSVALSREGRVYTWGKGEFYRLGHGTDTHVRIPQEVEALVGTKIVKIGVGSLHCLALSSSGEIYAWGDNDHGQQGNGGTTVNKTPQPVVGLDSQKITHLSCGSSHCVAWAETGVILQPQHTPIKFSVATDPLGSSMIKNKKDASKCSITTSPGSLQITRALPSLAKVMLGLECGDQKQGALSFIIKAMEVMFARDGVITALDTHVKGIKAPVETDRVLPLQHSLDLFELMGAGDACFLVELLKLAVVGRAGEHGKQALSRVLKSLGQANPEIAEILLEFCITELEDVVAEVDNQRSAEPVCRESPHPHSLNACLMGQIKFPKAVGIRIEFDPRCSTEKPQHCLTFADTKGRIIATRSGRDKSEWAKDIHINTTEINWKFSSDSSPAGWGFKFKAFPILPPPVSADAMPDRLVQAKPSIEMVMCLLDEDLEKSGVASMIQRLTSALASCAQLSQLSADKRTWALQHLRGVLQLDNCPSLDVQELLQNQINSSEGINNSLGVLVKGLLEVLQKQHDHEAPLVLGGKQLMHTEFFKTLVAFCCDLGLDRCITQRSSDIQKWSWFIKYCSAARVANALDKRTVFPSPFLTEVHDRVLTVCGPGVSDQSYANNSLFSQEMDIQLLACQSASPTQWSLTPSGSGALYLWGHNHRGQLGGIEGQKVTKPTFCESIAALQPTEVAAGEQTIFIISDGKVYSAGNGTYGRLGIGSNDSVSMPTLLKSIQHITITKIAVHSTGKHCLALSQDGEVFSWGEGDDGKLGHGSRNNQDRPRVIEALRGKQVIEVSAGGAHSAAITTLGRLYTWGKGRYGRLGHGDYDDQLKPKMVEALKTYKVTQVACGSGDAQTLCISEGDVVWSWGDGDYGKLGRGGSDGCKVPRKIDPLLKCQIVKIVCGSQFSMALGRNGDLYTWGKGDYHRLGHSSEDHVRWPQRVVGLNGQKVVEISCGSLFCVCVTDDHQVYAWGDNDEGQCGNGKTNAVPTPQLIDSLQGKRINRIACGSAHAIAWSTLEQSASTKQPDNIPPEYPLLLDTPIENLRNRLILLHSFSEIFSCALRMFSLEATSQGHKVTCSLRHTLVMSHKETAFKKVVQATMIRDRQHGPILELNRMFSSQARGTKDWSRTIFAQACSMLINVSSESFLLPHRAWKVRFVGESVDDVGGGYSESIAEMCEELQSGVLPLFILTPNGRVDNGVNRDCYLFNPAATSPEETNMFRFLGILMGISVRTGSPLALDIAPPMWKLLVGLPLSIDDMIEIDKDYMAGINFFRDLPNKEEEFDAIDMPFSTPGAAGQEVPLSSTYHRINLTNRDQYVQSALDYRLHEFDFQVQAVVEGLAKVIPVPLLSLFTGEELRTMVCGHPDIPLDMLKSVAVYKGVEYNSPLVQWFWEILEIFSPSERSLFLRFVWGRTRLPRNIADFRGRDFVLQVLDKYQPPDHYMPESYTCFFLLKMPRYSSKEILTEKLRYAINFCKSIDTDDYARITRDEGIGDGEDSDIELGSQ
ncbi:E3 ubiquitin-protein ligase HERC2-like isoform X2 [Bolinopsis microptera]|uniref:E3 ubiquitin-protein ligase HERC2-like isoform X2 n=1 Tax=Bolinopsis microptera TaxID=2820187 RepID=UPI0030797A73